MNLSQETDELFQQVSQARGISAQQLVEELPFAEMVKQQGLSDRTIREYLEKLARIKASPATT